MGDQVIMQIFYGIDQPGFRSMIEAIKTIAEKHKIQIVLTPPEPNSLIIIGTKK